MSRSDGVSSRPRRALGSRHPRLRPSIAEWGCLAFGAILTIHYAWVLDDAYVYFRYLDNWLLLDRGLVYNEGEYVEGYSSPLWLLLLAGLRAAGLPWWLMIRLLALLCFVVFWALVVRTNRRMSPADAVGFGFPTLFLCMNYAVQCYFSSGMETPLVQLLAPIYALYVLQPRSKALQALVAISPLVRHELAAPLAIAVLWHWWRERHLPWRLLLLVALTSGGWLAFRIYYYADLLPNTFYLKTGTDFAQGLRFLHDTLAPYHVYETLALAGVALAWLRWQRKEIVPWGLERSAMIVMALSVTLFVVEIGGGPRHYRYLAFPFCLLICALSGLAESVLAALPRRPPTWAYPVAAASLAVCVATLQPRQCITHPFLMTRDFKMVDKITDAAHHRNHDQLPKLSPWARSAEIDRWPERLPESERKGAKRPLPPLVEYICWIAYRALDQPVVHSLGLTEPILARTQMSANRPGHKWGLVPLAHDLANVRISSGGEVGRGMYERAVAAGIAAPWIEQNIDAIVTIEQKIYNEGKLLENLRLALTHVPMIVPMPVRRESAAAR